MELMTPSRIEAAPVGVLLNGMWEGRPALRAADRSKWVDDRDGGPAPNVGGHVGNRGGHGGSQGGHDTQGGSGDAEMDDHDTSPPPSHGSGGN